MKIIYDPYLMIDGLSSTDPLEDKVFLAAEYAIEIRKIYNNSSTHQEYVLNEETGEVEKANGAEDDHEEIVDTIRSVLVDIQELTNNYLSFRLAPKQALPSQKQIRAVKEANRDLTFKPRTNLKSNKIDSSRIEEQKIKALQDSMEERPATEAS